MSVLQHQSKSLRNVLTKVKDPLPIEKQSNVVYEAPAARCTSGKPRAGYVQDKSAIAKRAWTNDNSIDWTETKILRANGAMELVSGYDLDRHLQEIELEQHQPCPHEHSGLLVRHAH